MKKQKPNIGDLIGVEEDGEDVFIHTDTCTNFECITFKDHKPVSPKLKRNQRGFMVCPNCRWSYGRKYNGKD